jgi:hypothetical protein
MTAHREPLPTRPASSTPIGGAGRRCSAIALGCKGAPGVRRDEAVDLRRGDTAGGADVDLSRLFRLDGGLV